MIKRKKTKAVKVGNVTIGSASPIVVQSMTKVSTQDVGKCVKQVNQLAQAGCKLVRIAVPTKADTAAFAKIVQKVKIPLIADIHFSAQRAIEAIEAGAAKIRLNPGNIKNRKDIFRIIDAAKMHDTAIRIGVNEASIRDLKQDNVSADKRVGLMLKELKQYVTLFESRDFENIVLSAKSSNTARTIEVNRLISNTFQYPIHLGLTHAGLCEDAQIPSAVCLGSLLSEGIGDTVRISIAGNPVVEVGVARSILLSLGLVERQEPEIIVCPTCGRTQIDVVKLAKKVKKAVSECQKPLRIAVMGCFVNGPGEAADADLAICGGKGKAYIYKKGKKTAVVPEAVIIETVLQLIDKF
ncbi:MAG: flavodoxin-dependent (E)-4-hydroxy-3-methylbut-2-enyl-diphosphate synthase [Planctomycetes bacterium]|nr:flavodoxin-dependent (E)-4-hydroxy-3-methylbut-2-enyl-diphosphate synthase [Planctomycetota bacterium]MBL7106598.1 flavodoxin-dependent (E)-4-hydroxy-3-methylbut-2-enyl-diphosphate synthase [Phycisphaerae bacterium]